MCMHSTEGRETLDFGRCHKTWNQGPLIPPLSFAMTMYIDAGTDRYTVEQNVYQSHEQRETE
jgi:hypothetical protein